MTPRGIRAKLGDGRSVAPNGARFHPETGGGVGRGLRDSAGDGRRVGSGHGMPRGSAQLSGGGGRGVIRCRRA